MRIVYLVAACGVLAAVGAGGVFYYVKDSAHPPESGAAAPTPGAGQSFVVPSPSGHTVAWYQAHPDQIKEKLAACNNNPGTARQDPECSNAESAKDNNDIDSFINSAPKEAQPR
jgi:hypothetical protein